MSSNAWEAHAAEISALMEERGVESHHSWPVINATMIRSFTESELRERDEAADYFWKNHGTSFAIDSGTAAQQAFALRLMDEHCMALNDVCAVVELGAGLADMAKMAPRLMPNLKVYRILDLPPMLRIQEHILGDPHGIYELWDDAHGIFDGLPRNTVFVSICAISETSLLLRDRVFSEGGARKFVLRAQNFWGGENLLSYFDSWKPIFREESYYPGHWWLIR